MIRHGSSAPGVSVSVAALCGVPRRRSRRRSLATRRRLPAERVRTARPDSQKRNRPSPIACLPTAAYSAPQLCGPVREVFAGSSVSADRSPARSVGAASRRRACAVAGTGGVSTQRAFEGIAHHLAAGSRAPPSPRAPSSFREPGRRRAALLRRRHRSGDCPAQRQQHDRTRQSPHRVEACHRFRSVGVCLRPSGLLEARPAAGAACRTGRHQRTRALPSPNIGMFLDVLGSSGARAT